MKSPAEYAKAITGTAVAAIGLAVTVVTALDVHATWVPVLIAAATALGVGGGVYRTANRPATPPPAAPTGGR